MTHGNDKWFVISLRREMHSKHQESQLSAENYSLSKFEASRLRHFSVPSSIASS